MAYYVKKGSRGHVTLKSRGKFKILVEDLPTSTNESWRRKCFLVRGQWQEWHGHPFRVPEAFQKIVPQEYKLTELMECWIRRVLWAFECRSSYRICRLSIYSYFGYARVPVTMPPDCGSRKKEWPYDKVSDQDVLDGLLVEAAHAKRFDLDLETGEGKEVEFGKGEDDFVRLNLADEDYAYVPPLVAEVMGLGDQEVDEETETEDGDPGDNHEQVPMEEEHAPEPVGVEDVSLEDMGKLDTGGEDRVVEELEPIGQESEEIVVTRT
uniref:uncharacterized protein LOC105349532 n=1 Tax=Fragaria vesca subsp. vesca TaxID=101020 RepID=UPI0005CA497F|nr:PREDICTED: uncharacterized protein LOC105349532 [Fragaria vesca subsp. vesca]